MHVFVNIMKESNLGQFQVMNEIIWVSAMHEDAAMAHTLGVLQDEDAPAGSHVQ